MTPYEIRPLADGYGIYRNGVYVMWCYGYEWAQHRVEELLKEETK